MRLDHIGGPLAAFSTSVISAVATGQYTKLSQKYSVFSINFMRAFISLPLFILASFVMAGSMESGWALFQQVNVFHILWSAVSMTVTYGVGDAVFFIAARMIGLPTALAIASCSPIWTVLVGSMIDGKKISFSVGLGLFFTVSGIIAIVLTGASDQNVRHAALTQGEKKALRIKGIALAFITSFCWAMNSYAFTKLSLGIANAVANTCRMAMALIVIFIVSGFYKTPQKLFLPKAILKKFGLFFALESFMGSYCVTYGFAHSSLAISSTLTSLAPVISVPISVFLGLEKFSWLKTAELLWVVWGVCLLVGAISF